MAEDKIAPMIEYQTLENFVEDQNNFFLHFLDNESIASKVYRLKPCFKRFQEQYPEMERELTRAIVEAVKKQKLPYDLPYEQLWEAYKIMSRLVFLDDPHVMREGYPEGDNWFLCR